MTPIKFSIVTVTYNAAKVLESTIRSVLNQSYPHIEYILIDGKSTDGTAEIIERHADGIAYGISELDNGLYDAMNKGLRKATGDYVWFMNAGDTLKHENIVAELAELAARNGMPDIIYGETDLTDAGGTILGPRRLKAPDKLTWKSFRMGMLVCHQAFVVKRNVAPEYDPQYRFSGDFEWCIRCMKASRTILNSRLRIVNYLYEGLTTNNRRISLKERHAIMCKYYGAFSTDLLHLWFALRFYFAKCTGKKA